MFSSLVRIGCRPEDLADSIENAEKICSRSSGREFPALTVPELRPCSVGTPHELPDAKEMAELRDALLGMGLEKREVLQVRRWGRV